MAKKNALKAANQKGGVDKDAAAKKGTGKPPLVSKKLKKGGAPMKEVIIFKHELIYFKEVTFYKGYAKLKKLAVSGCVQAPQCSSFCLMITISKCSLPALLPS